MESFDQHGTPASQGTTARAGTSTTIRSGDEENYSYGEIDEGGEDTNLNSPEGEIEQQQQRQSPQLTPSQSQPTSARPNLYQKRSTPGVVGAVVQPLYSGPTPARLFKRTLSEQQFGNRPISEVPPTISSTAQQSKSLPLTSQRSIPESIHSIQQKRRSPSIIDLSVKVKEVSQSVKNAAEDELRYELIRFAARTTAHGIPMAAQATKWYAKWMWIIISLLSVGIFIYSVLGVLEKYQRREKIVSVQLRFDNVPFPAITICNLNPFKREEARHVPEISETLEAYHQAVTYSKHADLYLDETPAVRERRNIRGGHRHVQIEPVMSDCECLEGFNSAGKHDCAQLDSIPKDNVSLCICNYDRQDSSIWPCYSKTSWIEEWCPICNDIGYCTLPNTNTSNTVPCICQKSVNYCLIRPERLKRMWEVRGDKIPTEDSPFRTDFLNQLKELGYENMTDEVAITTKTREKLVLAMASLHKEQRKSLSYGRSEFIKMCSFNGQQCNINHDFKLHADPAFGNCYMFNANKSNPLVSSRAGPSYGLRLLVHINTSDYLPTTQASGVHIVIHSQDEHPFPDAFGYSAPTNQLSSFGISLRKVNRLPIPRGICLMPGEPKPEGYIYSDHKYEPEGCYKSCYQHQIIRRCGCSDPRYPQPDDNTKVCNSSNALDSNCLLVESIRFTRAQQCHCKHPCVHDVYTTAFSSARLISEAFRSFQCSGKRECKTEFDADSAAMLEIYYEQMSHEVLTESESYMFVNFISDIGGQAGLWLGASILTLFELFVFAFRIFTIVCRRRLRRNTIDFDIEDDDLEQQQKRSTSKVIPSSFTTTPKHSQMRKSASSLTSLSIRASALDAKVQAAKSERNTSLGSLNLAYQSPKTRKVTAEPFSARSARKLSKQTSFAVTEDEEEEEDENIEEGYYGKQLTPSSDERTLGKNKSVESMGTSTTSNNSYVEGGEMNNNNNSSNKIKLKNSPKKDTKNKKEIKKKEDKKKELKKKEGKKKDKKKKKVVENPYEVLV
uniref:Uncharacterized protein n=1 Tax=Meloidogyne enterolobii TaxID=390850 RepID=A0A6V7VBW5_MELEN|nr:unnamed protein product [Meloidogyne enterolobii]